MGRCVSDGHVKPGGEGSEIYVPGEGKRRENGKSEQKEREPKMGWYEWERNLVAWVSLNWKIN